MFSDLAVAVLGEELLSGTITVGSTTLQLSESAQGILVILSWACFILFLSIFVSCFSLIVRLFRG